MKVQNGGRNSKMKRDISFSIDNDIYEKFRIALRLTEEDENEAIENCMRAYIVKTFERTSQEYNTNSRKRSKTDEEKDFYGKAIQRIPLWAMKPNQYNHKIIRAFFEVEATKGKVTLEDMEQLCSSKEQSQLYVPTFRNNYSQLKIDGPKSYGKVFEDDGKYVWIWQEVEEVLRRHKENFIR